MEVRGRGRAIGSQPVGTSSRRARARSGIPNVCSPGAVFALAARVLTLDLGLKSVWVYVGYLVPAQLAAKPVHARPAPPQPKAETAAATGSAAETEAMVEGMAALLEAQPAPAPALAQSAPVADEEQ